MEEEKRHLYNAEAIGATGYLTLPVQDTMELQASIGLPSEGGRGTVRVGNFSHFGVLKFKSAESQVVGSEDTDSYGTLAQTTIEGLNIHDVVTCDWIVGRITSKHPKGGGEPTIIPLGTTFENLKIAGVRIEPKLAVDWFTEYGKWSDLDSKFKYIEKEFANMSMYPLPKGKSPCSRKTVGCTLVKNLRDINIPGSELRGVGIHIPQFGTIYLAEFFMTDAERRLNMIRVKLGCAVKGAYAAASPGGNGRGLP